MTNDRQAGVSAPLSGRGVSRGMTVGAGSWLVIAAAMFALRVNVGWVDLLVATFGAVIVAVATSVVAGWLSYAAAQQRPSTRAGTTRMMFALGSVSAIAGVCVGIACMVHTAAPGCSGWVGCGTNHPLVGVGIVCVVAGLLASAMFGALGYIARSVGEMQSAQLLGVWLDRQNSALP